MQSAIYLKQSESDDAYIFFTKQFSFFKLLIFLFLVTR